MSIVFSYGECYAGNGTAEGNEHIESVAFLSADSGSEPETRISVKVSILVSVTKLYKDFVLLM